MPSRWRIRGNGQHQDQVLPNSAPSYVHACNCNNSLETPALEWTFFIALVSSMSRLSRGGPASRVSSRGAQTVARRIVSVDDSAPLPAHGAQHRLAHLIVLPALKPSTQSRDRLNPTTCKAVKHSVDCKKGAADVESAYQANGAALPGMHAYIWAASSEPQSLPQFRSAAGLISAPQHQQQDVVADVCRQHSPAAVAAFAAAPAAAAPVLVFRLLLAAPGCVCAVARGWRPGGWHSRLHDVQHFRKLLKVSCAKRRQKKLWW